MCPWPPGQAWECRSRAGHLGQARSDLGESCTGRKDIVAKSKSKYILVRMKSAAETGYCFNIRRLRLQEKLVLLRYDPIAKQRVLFTEKRKIRSI
ncbi:PREDICTED: 39S ribosomal protein L33, mitochondrial [Chaetura pelagica]|uniref:39S ribosomal protein L33, mitochondrial n=1 Tax=Chaetura pelagica TaxID=8897 RepID=UPI000523CF3C|nr:PREDICTED: 39S ribosomal protein L33, mitochondrial [Chaetura pelagica]